MKKISFIFVIIIIAISCLLFSCESVKTIIVRDIEQGQSGEQEGQQEEQGQSGEQEGQQEEQGQSGEQEGQQEEQGQSGEQEGQQEEQGQSGEQEGQQEEQGQSGENDGYSSKKVKVGFTKLNDVKIFFVGDVAYASLESIKTYYDLDIQYYNDYKNATIWYNNSSGMHSYIISTTSTTIEGTTKVFSANPIAREGYIDVPVIEFLDVLGKTATIVD